jgi:ferric-chelate reductase (NADPH)
MQNLISSGILGTRHFGALENALLMLWAKRSAATLTEIQPITERFRVVTLEGDALKDARWRPGQKIQIKLDGLASRTFTPMLWDRDEGALQILVYRHEWASWTLSAVAGDDCMLFGPRDSVDLASLPRPLLFFGDESSLGLARALKATPAGFEDTHFVAETSSAVEIQAVIDVLNLPPMTLIERARDDAHMTEAASALRRVVETHAPRGIVLSGKARSIERLSRFLTGIGVPASHIHARPHWAPGRTGLD